MRQSVICARLYKCNFIDKGSGNKSIQNIEINNIREKWQKECSGKLAFAEEKNFEVYHGD